MIKKVFLAALISFLSFSFYSQEYGMVLSGGGGKGAYEVGVWKALSDYGYAQRITAISGTSVGGLNAGLFACEDPHEIERIWFVEVPYELDEKTDELINQKGLKKIIKGVHLEKLQRAFSYPKVYVTTTRRRFWPLKFVSKLIGFNFPHRFLLNKVEDIVEIENMLLATSAFPIATEAILLKDGYYHVDGGIADNTPLVPLTNLYSSGEFNQIFVVYLDNTPSKYLSSENPELNLLEIIPSEELGGLFEGTTNFKRSKIEHLIRLGYKDTVKIMKDNKRYPVSSYWFE